MVIHLRNTTYSLPMIPSLFVTHHLNLELWHFENDNLGSVATHISLMKKTVAMGLVPNTCMYFPDIHICGETIDMW